MFSEAVPSRTEKRKSIGIKSLYSNTSYGFKYDKICISKLSINENTHKNKN